MKKMPLLFRLFSKGLPILLLLFNCGLLQAQTNIAHGVKVLNACTDFRDGDIYTDSGGSAGDYSTFEDEIAVTFCAAAGETVGFTFTSFGTEGCCDDLTVLGDAGGNDGSYAGVNTPPALISAVGACLTFTFDSDGSVVGSGWEADISLSTSCGTPEAPVEILHVAPPPITLLNACTDFQDGDTYTDSGGPAGDYSINENEIAVTFCATAGETIGFNFISFDTESCCDDLTVLGDAGGNDGSYAGGNTPPALMSAVGACLTFTFDSDGSVNGSGWEANISVSSCPTPTADITFCADLNCLASGAAAAVAGSWDGNNPGSDFLSDPDGNGVYCTTVTLLAGVETFSFFTAGEQFEDLSGIAGEACATSTDAGVKREITIVAGVAQTVTYGWESCEDNCPAPPTADITFCADLTCLPSGAAAAVAGSFNNNSPGTDFLTDPDGDGIYCKTVAVPEGVQTFRFFTSGEQFEDLSGLEGEACATGTGADVRRAITVVADVAQMVTYGWESCDAVCPPPPPGTDLPITFEDPNLDYNLIDFGDATSFIAVDITDATNMVLCQSKNVVGAQPWAGTTIGDSGLDNPIPFSPGNTTITMSVWAPTAGTPILLKVENSGNAGIAAEVLVTTTVGLAFETLSFDFSLSTISPLDLNQVYDKISVFGNFGNSGIQPTVYFDDIMLPAPPVICTGNVPIENLANGMDYTIASAADGTVDVTVTVVDNPPGLVAFYGGAGNPISFPDATGTFTYNFPGQTIGDAFVVDIFFNWAGNGGNSETVTVIVGGPCTVPDTDVTFCVDMSCFPEPPLNPSVFGSFSTPPFDPNQNLLSDMGGGIWCATVTIPPGDYEYLFFDGNQGAEDFAEGAPCTVSSFGFTNRTLTVGATSPQMENFGWESCGLDCVPPPIPPDLPITFDDPDVTYNLVNFGDMNAVIGVDPLDPNNKVVCATKPAGAQCWAGTTIACLENPIPFGPGNMIMTMDVYSPNVNTPFLLKAEDCNNPAAGTELLAFTTVANAWETLIFDFSNGCSAPPNPAISYSRLSVFAEFSCSPDVCGNPFTGETPTSGLTYYFDNIMMCDQSLLPVITCPDDVTIDCDEDISPANTGMATATDLCAEPDVTFADGSSTQGQGCSAYGYTFVRTWTATDNLGLTATCSQTITVQDVTPPSISCPADVSRSCTDSTIPADTGMATSAGDNCSSASEIIISSSDVTTQLTDGCGQFTFVITRTWTATDACGNANTCDQTIAVADTEAPEITCPPSQTLNCNSNPFPLATTIAEFVAIGGMATDNCSSMSELAISFYNIPATPGMLNFCSANPADRTMTRTYTITDACGNATTCTQDFIYNQVLNRPVSTGVPLDQTVDCAVNAIPQPWLFTAVGECSDITYTVSGPSTPGRPGCSGENIRYTYTGTDKCGRSVSYTQIYTLANEGPAFVCPSDICVIECPADTDMIQAQFDNYANLATVITSCEENGYSVRNNFNPNGFTSQNCMNPTVAVDNAVAYQIVKFTATDDCGREGTCTALVVLKDNHGPVMNGTVSFGLADCTDDDLQAGYTTWANNQLNGLSATDEDCAPNTVTLSYAPLSPNVDCSSGVATTVVSFTATDGCGNTTVRSAFYRIIDNGTSGPTTATVSGNLITEEDEMVSLADVMVEGVSNDMMTTSADGYYHFNLEMAQNYTIAPSRNDDPLNGVTTYDLILIGQHILGMNQLDSPYKMIAADVNETGDISGLDIIELRRLILQITDEFSVGKSWTFVDAGYNFPQPTNPFATTFPTVYNINDLSNDKMIDFIGVKLGDVNATANPTLLQAGDTRSADGTLQIKLEDQLLKAGQTYELNFTASDFNEVAGFQFTLDFAKDYLALQDYQGSELKGMTADNFGFTKSDQGKITVSWNANQSVNLSDEATLFQFAFTALQDGQLSEVLSINSSMTAQEAYQADLRKDVVLDFGNRILLPKEFSLLQNRPNPFSLETVIGFQLPESTQATLTIFDVAGRVILTQTKDYDAGVHQFLLNKSDLGATGVLYYQLSTAEDTATKKMIILK